MEHVTEGIYFAAAAALFVLAVSLMLLSGRYVDRLFAGIEDVQPGSVLMREAVLDE